ncbi:uncharacterized protein LOC114320109 isoform X1 [Camellia sinensis]|uniref:uncharacterized protein LOC114320109 isoform X1 n=1 Tax=Camellia sinensis TaxID=4442 RepID=UPI001036340A|nr:uncharacterized protein LOC114320109 isoform X1 [Camellia sinensis]
MIIVLSIVEDLDKQYADVLLPLKENLTPKNFGLKYVQKLTKRSVCPYVVPDELGILLNSMKRMLDILRSKIEHQLNSWGSCIPDRGSTTSRERLSEVTVMLRTEFRNYLQAVVEKLAGNVSVILEIKCITLKLWLDHELDRDLVRKCECNIS